MDQHETCAWQSINPFCHEHINFAPIHLHLLTHQLYSHSYIFIWKKGKYCLFACSEINLTCAKSNDIKILYYISRLYWATFFIFNSNKHVIRILKDKLDFFSVCFSLISCIITTSEQFEFLHAGLLASATYWLDSIICFLLILKLKLFVQLSKLCLTKISLETFYREVMESWTVWLNGRTIKGSIVEIKEMSNIIVKREI